MLTLFFFLPSWQRRHIWLNLVGNIKHTLQCHGVGFLIKALRFMQMQHVKTFDVYSISVEASKSPNRGTVG